MPSLDPNFRRLIAQIGANAKWAATDPVAGTQAARDARLERYLTAVDPDAALPEPERLRRALALRRADMQRMALRSAQVRRARKGGDAA